MIKKYILKIEAQGKEEDLNTLEGKILEFLSTKKEITFLISKEFNKWKGLWEETFCWRVKEKTDVKQERWRKPNVKL